MARRLRGPPLVSVEQEVAKSLGLKIGDTLSVNVLGVEVQAEVASFRTVNWDNFGLNYVMVFSPGTFDAAPHNMVATVAVDNAAEAELARSIPRTFPSASLIAVRDVVSQVTLLLTQMSQAIAAAASIAILAGIAVLIGAIAASRERRVYDSVILKLLGATRRQILGAQAMEYAVLAAVLAVLALGLGLLAARSVVVSLFEVTFARPDRRPGAARGCRSDRHCAGPAVGEIGAGCGASVQQATTADRRPSTSATIACQTCGATCRNGERRSDCRATSGRQINATISSRALAMPATAPPASPRSRS